MTQEQHTEGVNATDESIEDSPVIKALRKQIKDLEKLANAAPTRESIEAEIRTELERESAISEQLVALGHPAGMSVILKGTLGEADVTRESVAAALQGIGYTVDVGGATSEPEGEPSAQSDLAQVTNLSAQVRSAASGVDLNDMMRKINAAPDQATLVQLAQEGGFLNTH